MQLAQATLEAAVRAAPAGNADKLIVHSQASIPENAVERLRRAATFAPDATAISALDNSDAQWCPLPTCWTNPSPRVVDTWVYDCSDRRLWSAAWVSQALSFWPAENFPYNELRELSEASDLARDLTAADRSLYAADHIYSHIAGLTPRSASPSVDPLATLRRRLASRDPETAPTARYGLAERAVTLHVLHDWGGGVQQWVSDISRSQDDRDHLWLVASGGSGEACGQQLRLIAAGQDNMALAEWPLPKPIWSTVDTDPDYRAALGEIIDRYGVTQIVVSSLIGHALDCLRTDCQTLVVWHDFYPAWPLLDIAFDETNPEQFSTESLASQLARGRDLFGDKKARHWLTLRNAYLESLTARSVHCVAPSQSVIDGLMSIDPRFAEIPATAIPHGLAPWPVHDYAYQLDPELESRRLRILVPGRISINKGKSLLLGAITEITQFADVYLLGAGKDGEDFFGVNGVHVVLQYNRDQLPQLLAQIQPDVALLLSAVAETFSYTLSEMQSLGLPVLATAMGSLNERLANVPGALFQPEVAPMLAALKRACSPNALQHLTSAASHRSLSEMAASHSRLSPARVGEPLRYSCVRSTVASQREVASISRIVQQEVQIQALEQQREEDQKELDARSEWGYQLSKTVNERTAWAKSLEDELASTRQAWAETRRVHEALREEFDERTEWALNLDDQVSQLDDRLSQVVNSRSWQLTKPLRFAARQGRKLLDKLGFQTKRAKTLANRTRNSLRVRGLRGTLDRIGSELKKKPTQVEFHAPHVEELALHQPLAFPPVTQPLASIVIPVFNQFEHTWRCLKSLLEADTSCLFEVIVVDDASSDETEQKLAAFTGITYLRNPENLGFIGSCNRAASAATGNYLVLLNNDTAVGDHWLDALLDTFDTQADAGLVGAKLVYPSGELQEAGGIVFADGSGWNYGRNDDPNKPEYNFVREVDYCSGACIALPLTLWQQFGGFDTRYTPAYYEDTDLAMQIRQHGHKVYFQPAAVVTHFEGISSGTDTASGIKRYQLLNQEKFVDKWRDTLQTNHPRPGTDIRVARAHRRARRALIIDACTPTPDQDSGSLRMTNLMQILGELDYQVSFLADNRRHEPGYTEALQQQGVEMLYRPWVDDPQALLKTIGAELDLVILSRHYVASQYVDAVRWHCPKARVLFDTVDLHYLREQRLARLENDSRLLETAANTKREELGVAKRCDTTLVVSEHELGVLATDAPELNVAVLSNIHQVFGCRRPFAARRDMFFIGGFQHPPNIDAVHWLANEIWPLVRMKLPEAQCYVIGSKAPKAVRDVGQVDGIVFKGYVEDIEPYLDGCKMSLAPLRYGAGVKGKVNMSMSYGQPVVATGPAVEGMHVTPGDDVLVGDEPGAIAEAIVAAYTDESLWNRLSANGLANVEAHFSFAAAKRALAEILA